MKTWTVKGYTTGKDWTTQEFNKTFDTEKEARHIYDTASDTFRILLEADIIKDFQIELSINTPDIYIDLMKEAEELEKLRGGRRGSLDDATPEQEERFNRFAAKLEAAYDDGKLDAHSFNEIACTAFYDYDLKYEPWMNW